MQLVVGFDMVSAALGNLEVWKFHGYELVNSEARLYRYQFCPTPLSQIMPIDLSLWVSSCLSLGGLELSLVCL